MTRRITRQPRCSSDPEPTTVDAVFGLTLMAVIVCCFVALWLNIPQDIVSAAARYWDFRAWLR